MSGVVFQWAAISAIVGLVSVITVLVLHIIKYGEEKGAMRERVKRLEQEMIEQKEIKDTVIELRHTVGTLNGTIEEFKSLLHIMMNQQGIAPFIIKK